MFSSSKNNITILAVLAFIFSNTFFAQTVTAVVTTDANSCLRVTSNVGPESKGEDVKKIQTFLKSQGLFGYVVSGVFSAKTQSAVRLFQAKKLSGVNVEDVDQLLIPNVSLRQSIADKGFVVKSTGVIDEQTRAKILYVTCKKVTANTAQTSSSPAKASTFSTSPSSSNLNTSTPWLYGYYYLDYSASNNDLDDLATYTNFGSAKSVDQVSLLRAKGFKNIMYVALFSDSLSRLLTQEGVSATGGTFSTYDFRMIPNYEAKILSIYKQDLISLKSSLSTTGNLDAVTDFFIVDEPALHRNYIPNQAFLDKIEETFKTVFPDKKSSMAFAEDVSDPTSSSRGAHLLPPPTLSVVIVDPYFFEKKYIGCSQAEIKKFLYTDNPNSTIDWAKQFGKPIYVAADAMVFNQTILPECYYKETFKLMKQDSQVRGLIWFMYDSSFSPEDITWRGANTSKKLINLVKGFTLTPTVTLNPFSPSTIEAGKTSTISFTSTNAETCTGQGIWNGDLGGTYTNPQGAVTPVMTTPGTYTQTVTCSAPGLTPKTATVTLTVNPQTSPIGGITVPSVTLYSGVSFSTVVTNGTIDTSASIKLRVTPLPSASKYYLSIAYGDNNNGSLVWNQKGPFTGDVTGTLNELGFIPGTYYFKVKTCDSTNVCTSFADSQIVKLVVLPSSSVLGVSTQCFSFTRNLARGAEGEDVSLLQSFLMEKGFMEGEVTGFYGDTTKTALKAYQTSAGLPSTGFLYELTRIKIESETCR